ncbi:putative DnaB-like replicative helicase [Pseudoalteromonas virus vB_PspP-H6/1]|nr:putative DnaB-like replicative helicase [Pseudoalteromonas virus vB_PspP-H6/1]
MENLNVPPHSIQAEQGILGSLMIMDAFDHKAKEAKDLVSPAMFYTQSHQIIYNSIVNLKECDMVTVSEDLERRGSLEDAGGFAYLAEICKATPSTSNILSYCEIVQERFQLREVLAISHKAAEQSYNLEPSNEIINNVVNSVATIDANSAYEPIDISTKMDAWITKMEKRLKGEDKTLGEPCGIKGLDDSIGGIGSSWLVVVAGRPSMGKTKVAQMMAQGLGVRGGSQFFSMEMSDDEIMDRVIGIGAGVSPANMRSGQLSDYEWGRVNDCLRQINDGTYKMFLDVDSGLSANQVRARVKAAKKRNSKLKGFIVDYLELMKLENADRPDLQIAETVKMLKQISKDLEVPCILLAQANRSTDDKKRPTMSNLYGSSAIEKYADLVMFVHRDDVANPDTVYKGITMILPAKFRHGDLPDDIFLAQKPDCDGGYFYELDHAAKGELEHRESLNSEPSKYRSKSRG